VVLPVFDTGRNIANLRVSEADRDIAVLNYEKTIQAAFREVSDALARRATIGEQLEGQSALAAAAKAGYDLSLVRYEAGIDDFLTVLDAQRTYTAAQQGLIAARLLREVTMLTLYKALGGGWQ
jgi:multidrug efflux system outer membrane protein